MMVRKQRSDGKEQVREEEREREVGGGGGCWTPAGEARINQVILRGQYTPSAHFHCPCGHPFISFSRSSGGHHSH